MKLSRFCLLLVLTVCMGMVPADDPYKSIDIVSLANKPIVKATLNGQDAYFLIDTGSELTVFNTKISEDYRFAVRDLPDMWAIHSIGLKGNTGRMQGVEAAKLFLGDTRIKGRWFGADMSTLVYSIRKKTRLNIVGIIGSDVMKKYGFVISYDDKKIYLREPLRGNEKHNREMITTRPFGQQDEADYGTDQ